MMVGGMADDMRGGEGVGGDGEGEEENEGPCKRHGVQKAKRMRGLYTEEKKRRNEESEGKAGCPKAEGNRRC
jgi:hypothetical protein